MRRPLRQLFPLLLAAAALACTAPEPGPTPEPETAAVTRPAAPPATGTRVVFLGTGTPLPDPEHSGPATAVIADGAAYVFDAGPGVVRRAAQAARDLGIPELAAVNLRVAFLTHLHSDHTMGLPDLILTPWVMGREEPLELYGPPGTQAMADGVEQTWALDIDRRLNGQQPATARGYQVNAHEVAPGVVYQDASVTVTAIPVEHGEWEAFGYRIDTADRTIVISGDARPSPALEAACDGCDLLIHEVYTVGSTEKVSPEWQAYRRAYHTSTEELGAIASRSRPRLLVLYHRSNPGCDQAPAGCGTSGSEAEALEEMRRFYDGEVVEAHDLDVF